MTGHDLDDNGFQREVHDPWPRHGGLIAVRGPDHAATSPEGVMARSGAFGKFGAPAIAVICVDNSGADRLNDGGKATNCFGGMCFK